MNETKMSVKGNFFIMPNRIFDARLSPTQFYVNSYLRRCNNKQRGCFPSRCAIARNCGIATSTVNRALNELERLELIERHHNFKDNRQINNSYTILEPQGLSQSEGNPLTIGEGKQEQYNKKNEN